MKIVLLILAFGLTLFLIIGFIQANKFKSITIVKKVDVNADLEEAYNMVLYLNNFPKWSPFLAIDPTQKYSVKGVDGTIGAQYHWEGNEGKDLGYQEIVAIDKHRYIGMKCKILKPFQSNPTFDYYFRQKNDGVSIEQSFALKSRLVDAFFLWLFGVKGQMEKTNERGMEMLKAAIEIEN